MKFKVGEIVKIKAKREYFHRFKAGNQVKIIDHRELYRAGGSVYAVRYLNPQEQPYTGLSQWILPEDLEPLKTALEYILESL